LSSNSFPYHVENEIHILVELRSGPAENSMSHDTANNVGNRESGLLSPKVSNYFFPGAFPQDRFN